MKNFLLLFVFIPLIGNAQQNAQPAIDTVAFPYHKGYHMHFKGATTIYNQRTGEAEDQYNSELIYDIDSEIWKGDNDQTNFFIHQVSNRDTSIITKSPLFINKRGMCYWRADEDAGGEDDKHRTWAIELPLYDGKVWRGYNDDEKTFFRCVKVDDTLETPLGKFPCFTIEHNYFSNEQKDYRLQIREVEHYNQVVGKVGIDIKIWFDFYGKADPILIETDKIRLVDYTGNKQR